MAKIFLVDLENVGWNNLPKLNKYNLTRRDRVYIFHGANTSKCPFVALKNIFQIPARIETVPVKTGPKNALDLQLACFLGRKAKGSSNEFFIVSKDKSFSVLESFLTPVKVNLVNPSTEAEQNEGCCPIYQKEI